MSHEQLPEGWACDEMAAREEEKLTYLSVDVLWDALRKVACSTNPSTDAKCIVMLRREHVAKAMRMLPDYVTINGPVA